MYWSLGSTSSNEINLTQYYDWPLHSWCHGVHAEQARKKLQALDFIKRKHLSTKHLSRDSVTRGSSSVVVEHPVELRSQRR
jgi:hypothetical protein